MDFDDLLVRAVNLLELFQEVRDRYAQRLPPGAGRRVPGHQPRPVPLAPAADRRAPQPGGGRRRRPVDLRLPRSRHPEHPRLRGRLPRRPRGQARAELPLDADDPRRRQRGRSPTTAGRWPSTCGPTSGRATRSRSASWPTSTPRRGSSPARSSGSSTRASARAEIAVFYRTNAQSRVLEDMLVRAQIAYQVIGGTKFYERAEIKDAIAYLHVPGQPAGRGRVHADRQLAAARDRADVAVARARHADDDGHDGVGGRGGPRRRARPRRPRRARRSARFMSTMERLRERAEGGAPVGELLESC